MKTAALHAYPVTQCSAYLLGCLSITKSYIMKISPPKSKKKKKKKKKKNTDKETDIFHVSAQNID